jgi:ElaA protein
MHLRWELKKFNDLAPQELYCILQLRNEVFVVEQNCVFQDADDKDQKSWHLCGWQNNKLVAYTRLVPPGEAYELPSIGRVVTSPSVRNTGAGRELMKRSIEAVLDIYGNLPIQIGAQFYLKKFYQSFGFEQTSSIYLEDGIEHIYMVRPVAS